MLIYLQTEALRTNSREVELGKSLRDWLRRMDIPYGGKSLRELREQADRLARCRLPFHLNSGGKAGLLNQNLLDEPMFVSDEADQGCLFVEHAKLSESYFNSLKRHPVPIEEAAIRSISNNSQAIDAYLWPAYRLHSLPHPIVVSWKALHVQFGNRYSRLDDFRRRFIDTLALALAVYPEAKIEIDTKACRHSPQRQAGGGEVDHGGVAFVGFVVAHGDAAERFQRAEDVGSVKNLGQPAAILSASRSP